MTAICSEPVSEPKPVLIKSWQLLPGYNKILSVEIDTGLLGFQITNPVFKNTLSASNLGNTGLAATSDFFSDRVLNSDYLFTNYFQYYFHTPENIRFYNTKRPYTRIGFTTAGPQKKNEKILSILHTQNINPGFNVGFLYDNISSEGHYNRQNAKTNALSIFSNLKIKRYLFHAHININTLQVLENGGLLDENDLNLTDLGTEDLLVKLNNAETKLNNTSLFLVQKYQLLGKTAADSVLTSDDAITLPGMRLGHVFHFNRTKRLFSDIIPIGSDFYPDFFINPEKTADSVYFRSFRNDFFVEMPKLRIKSFAFSADAGISQELFAVGYSIIPDSSFVFLEGQPVDTIINTFTKKTFSNYSVFGKATTALTDRITINASLKYFLAGFRLNDLEFIAAGVFKIPFLKREVIVEPEFKQLFITPSFFLKDFSSNHFMWDNSFDQIKLSSIGGKLIIPDLRFKAGLQLFLINDYVFFNRQAVPEQIGDGIEIFTAFLEKDFQFWRFNIRSRFAYQKSGNSEVIHLPDVLSYHSITYTQTIIKDVLTAQAGFDVYYNTPYYVPAYQPATSQFYLQNEKKYGGYPYMDAFMNFSIKRTRIFVKVEHFNSEFFNKDYFTVLGYPRNPLVTRFGLVWNFYD